MIGWVMSWYTRLWMGLKRCWSLLARSVLNPAKEIWDYNSSSSFLSFFKSFTENTPSNTTSQIKIQLVLWLKYDLGNERNWLKKLEFSYLPDFYISLNIGIRKLLQLHIFFLFSRAYMFYRLCGSLQFLTLSPTYCFYSIIYRFYQNLFCCESNSRLELLSKLLPAKGHVDRFYLLGWGAPLTAAVSGVQMPL